ncbi:archaellin/type IV pilin N-terminal domain-containing protein [Natronoarchaeum mannanilyticum]|uniref:Flagellin n=1 Tax=Natronoarchaeum mannanilyticum TaxID=926360 RepID=A0AAV3T839_9EURY
MDITIPDISRDSDRGQVGIETLIIFIAMILVAAIAASVLINTAGYLQNQASATSEDSEAQVSNQVLVLSSIGEIDTEYGPELDSEMVEFEFDNSSDIIRYVDNDNEFDFTADRGDLIVNITNTTSNTTITDSTDFEAGDVYDLSKADGTLNDTDIEVTWEPDTDSVSNVSWSVATSTVGPEKTATLGDNEVEYRIRSETQISHVSMTVMQSPGANEIDLAGASVEYIGPDGEETLSYSETSTVGGFTVNGTTDSDNTAPVLTSRQDRFTIGVTLSDDQTNDLRYLQEGEEATVRIVTQSGSVATAVLNVPESLSSYDGNDAVEL